MTRRGLYSSDYDDDARERLGAVVEQTRRALGYDKRHQFKAASGIGVRSIEKIERGERGVGPDVFGRLQRALPGWGPDTVKQILDGGPTPPTPTKPPARLDIRWHTRDKITELLTSNADAATALRQLATWHQQFKDAGLSGDDLLAVSEEALEGR